MGLLKACGWGLSVLQDATHGEPVDTTLFRQKKYTSLNNTNKISRMHNHSENEGFWQIILEVFNHAVMITFFVIVMMMIIELINIRTKGKTNKSLHKKGFVQILLAAFMGITPGCLGTFAIVSLYIHRTISFAALVTVMIATSGDEIFVMFAMLPPKTSFILIAVLLVVAIISGLIVHLFSKKEENIKPILHLHTEYLETNNAYISFSLQKLLSDYKKISFERALLLFGMLVFIVSLISGTIGSHDWNWEKITFLITAIIGLVIIATASEHFLNEHLWKHIIGKHFMKIFLWTFGAFVFIHLLDHYIDVESWMQSNKYVILIIAVLIGIIPESGPHIVFISLYSAGSIPFSILLANSIVQDGHGAIPLLAESRKSFITMKLINAFVGLSVGSSLLLLGF